MVLLLCFYFSSLRLCDHLLHSFLSMASRGTDVMSVLSGYDHGRILDRITAFGSGYDGVFA